MKQILKTLTPIAVLALAAFGAHAQGYPASGKVVTIVVPFSAGGPTDRVRPRLRMLATEVKATALALSARLGHVKPVLNGQKVKRPGRTSS